MPLCCPKCNNVMKKKLDKPNYRVHKKCHNCVVKSETKLRSDGKYTSYIKKLEAKNSIDILNEMESYLLEALNSSNSGFVSEDGVIEKWRGGINKKEMTKNIKEASKIRREHIKKNLNE